VDVDNEVLCDHRRSWQYFVDSILVAEDDCPYTTVPCPDLDNFDEDFLDGNCFSCDSDGDGIDDCGRLGYHAQESPGRGKQYLRTHRAEDSPDTFCGKKALLPCFYMIRTHMQPCTRMLITIWVRGLYAAKLRWQTSCSTWLLAFFFFHFSFRTSAGTGMHIN
jgi:hypothetical protein